MFAKATPSDLPGGGHCPPLYSSIQDALSAGLCAEETDWDSSFFIKVSSRNRLLRLSHIGNKRQS